MAVDKAKMRRAIDLSKSRERAKKEQSIAVGRWPTKPIITKKQAVYEFGEEAGPELASLMNSGRRRPSRCPELEKVILTWAKANSKAVGVFQLPPDATEATWEKARQWCRKAEVAGEFGIIVVGT